MYDKNPDTYKDAKLIKSININKLKNYDSDFGTQSTTGTGGFVTKIQAAKRAALSASVPPDVKKISPGDVFNKVAILLRDLSI